jgi:hypothetical protein
MTRPPLPPGEVPSNPRRPPPLRRRPGLAGFHERTFSGVVFVEARGKGQSGPPGSGFEVDMHFADQANRG